MSDPLRPLPGVADPAAAPPGALVCGPDVEVRLPPPPFGGTPAGLVWEQVGGPAAAPDEVTAASPLVRVPAALANTRLVYAARPADAAEPVHAVTLWVGPDATSPAAEAGGTQVVAEGELVLLDGRRTRLPAGLGARDVGWQWVQVAGPPVALSDPWSLTPAFRAPEGLVSSDVRLELRVTHGPDDGTSSVSTVDVLVFRTEDTLAVESTTPTVVAAGDVLVLSAAVECDPRERLEWRWRQVEGPPVALDDERAAAPRVVAPRAWRNVRLAFEVTANDGTRAGSARIELVVEPDEDAPAVALGEARVVSDGDHVRLDAELLRATGAVPVRWYQLAGPPVLLRPADAAVGFYAPDVARARIEVACVAGDATAHAVATVVVEVDGDEDAPRVDAGPTRFVAPGERVELRGHAEGADGRPARLLWRQVHGPRVALGDATAARTTFVAPGDATDPRPLTAKLVLALHAFHADLESVATVTVHVGAPEPLGSDHAGARQEVAPGDEVRLGAWDETDLLLLESCAWRQVAGPPVQLLDENAPHAWFRAPEGYANTTLTFELDAVVAGARVLDTVDVTVEPDEDAPVAHVAADRRAAPRELVRLAAFARDPEGLSLQKRWRQLAGPPVALDDATSTRPTFAAPVLATPEDLVFEFSVTDGVTTVVETARVAVAAAGVDDAPSLLRVGRERAPRTRAG